jgi:hypothetical protein
MKGTGNFQITLVRDANPDMKFGISLLPGLEPGRPEPEDDMDEPAAQGLDDLIDGTLEDGAN